MLCRGDKSLDEISKHFPTHIRAQCRKHNVASTMSQAQCRKHYGNLGQKKPNLETRNRIKLQFKDVTYKETFVVPVCLYYAVNWADLTIHRLYCRASDISSIRAQSTTRC